MSIFQLDNSGAANIFKALPQEQNIRVLNLKETDPYKRGFEQGVLCKEQIKTVYEFVLSFINKRSENQNMKQFEKDNIPPAILAELNGLAEGSGFSFEDVFKIHTFLDNNPGQFGCSTLARKTLGQV
ncbi:MAG: hypothetical protein AB7O96_20155, partial [Pseudobdellovibrionaceae bacterium]